MKGTQEDLTLEELERVVRLLHDAGKTVILLGEIPQQEVDELQCHARQQLESGLKTEVDCDVSWKSHVMRVGDVHERISNLQKRYSNVCFFDPDPVLCDNKGCVSEVEGKLIYLDNGHLNQDGSIYIAKQFEFTSCLAGINKRVFRGDALGSEREAP